MAEKALEPTRRVRKVRPIRIVGQDAFITLTKGLEAVIDVADLPLVDQWNWYASVCRTGHAYACRSAFRDGKNISVGMHRVIMGFPLGEVDHLDGDGLNNRRSNLRVCTHAQNMASRVLDRRNKFGAKGVYMRRGKYAACIQSNGKTINLGCFETPQEAAAAYAGAAKALFKEFAKVA